MGAPEELSFLTILFTTLKDLSFWTGFITIVAFAMGRFNEKKPDEQELDPPLPNRCFTSRFRFASSALIYILVYLMIYSALVVSGSIPALQGVLTELFGSLDVGEKIGTPAWAAMILMVIAPTLGPVKRADTELRRWLMGYANIPYKARDLADEIVVAVRRKIGASGGDGLQLLSAANLTILYESLTRLRDRLCSTGGERVKAAYNMFFNVQYSGTVKAVDQRYQTVKHEFEVEHGEKPPERTLEESLSFRRQIADLVQRNARLIACALLQVEAEEYSAREAVRTRGGYPDLEAASFRFSKSQTILGLLLVFLTSVTVGPLVQLFRMGATATPGQVWEGLQRWAFWGCAGAFAYLLPLVLAASVQLWLLDKEEEAEEEGIERDWMFKLSVLLTTLFGCFLLAGIPLFTAAIVRARIFSDPYSPFVVFFALVPACVAVLFIPLSRRRLKQRPWINAVEDFVAFGAVAAATSYSVGSLLKLASLATQNIPDMMPLYVAMTRDMPAVAAIAFFIGGGFGALQCSASRQLVEALRERKRRTALAVESLAVRYPQEGDG